MKVPRPIPIHGYLKGDFANAGTAFLVQHNTSVWLVTCLHSLTGQLVNPIKTTHLQPGSISVVGNSLSLPLSIFPNRVRIVEEPFSSKLIDVISVRLSSNEIFALNEYGQFDASLIREPNIGEKVDVTGFPKLGAHLIGSSEFQAEVEALDLWKFKLNKPSAKGYSGGPVSKGDKLFGIVYGDTGSEPAYTNAIACNLSVLKQNLFV
ncbi:hypothetical protein ACLBWX_00905 [Methylobacterium sp. M6A4_1b]